MIHIMVLAFKKFNRLVTFLLFINLCFVLEHMK